MNNFCQTEQGRWQTIDPLLELVRVTEEAAVKAGKFTERTAAIESATAAIQTNFINNNFNGKIVIGEDELDTSSDRNSPRITTDNSDPLTGVTTILTKGLDHTILVAARAITGFLMHVPNIYMDKIAVGPRAAGTINIDAPLVDNLLAVANAKNRNINELVIAVLDRPRHKQLIANIHELGATVKLIDDGDITAALNAGLPDMGIDMFLGCGGAIEGVLAAVALKALGGELQGRLLPTDDEEVARCLKLGIDNPDKKILYLSDLVPSDNAVFVATGVFTGELLPGVLYENNQAVTHSIVMNSQTGTVRYVKTNHSLHKSRTPKIIL